MRNGMAGTFRIRNVVTVAGRHPCAGAPHQPEPREAKMGRTRLRVSPGACRHASLRAGTAAGTGHAAPLSRALDVLPMRIGERWRTVPDGRELK